MPGRFTRGFVGGIAAERSWVLIIYGFRTRERTVGGGEFGCPCCKFQRPYSEVESKRWFALYFIPLFPVYYQGRHILCHTCGQTFGLEVIQIASPFHGQAGHAPVGNVPMAGVAPPPIAHAAAQGLMHPTANHPGASHPSAMSYGPTQPGGHAQPGMATRYSYEPPPTSGLGIVSMVLGILSPFFFLACGASIFTAIGAVICGHLSLLKKGDASGRAPARGSAITGLVLGYTFLVLSPFAIYFSYSVYRGIEDSKQRFAKDVLDASRNPTGSDLLHEMEMKVVGASDGVAHGNTEEAKQLAQEFSDALLRARDENFVGGNPKAIKLTKGKFVVCCELKQDSCAFIVHVPEFRNFTDDAKEGLADLAWSSAQETAIKRIGPKGALAVGLKGVLLYGAVMAGNCQDPPRHREVAEAAEKDYLIAFLEVAQETEDEAIAASANKPDSAPQGPAETTAPTAIASSQPAPAQSAPSVETPPAAPPVAYTPLPGAIGSPPLAGGSAPNTPADSGAPELPGDSGVPRGVRGSNSPPKSREFVPPGLPVPKIEMHEPIVITQAFGAPRAITFSTTNKYLAAQVDSRIAIFDLTNRKEVAAEQCPIELFGVGAMLFADESQKLFVGGGAGAIQLWEFHSRGALQPQAALSKQASGITTLKARRDATFIVGGELGGNLFWQQIKSNQGGTLRQLKGLPTSIKDIYLPETGLEFFATNGLEVAQINMKTEKLEFLVKLEGVYSSDVQFSDDGRYLATGFGRDLIILDATTGKIAFRHPGPELLFGAVAWLPGQDRVLISMRGGPALFDAKKGYITQIRVGKERSNIQAIEVSQDGSLAAITTVGVKEIYLATIEK